ncbi:hypothetical protein GQ607_017740 [Colletotrichum asianum]|uniref:Uncharacterized protein n=1 Tax=Colletotrichum asianum TaxID=702518 RepID=A0A8H3VX05_9PEZI|nr:hypothetical protein GQ607_017740 [Colletotrichum asianum]
MERRDEPPGDICQILCLTGDGQTPSTCMKYNPELDDATRIQRRFHHIRAVQGKRDKAKIGIINKMEAWLLPHGNFDRQRFSGALQQSQGCDWQCCSSKEAAANHPEKSITVVDNATAETQTAEESSITVSTTTTQSQSKCDQSVASRHIKCLKNWKITEDELTRFFIDAPTGNTGRSIGKFAESAQDWERAKDALLQAKAERMKATKGRVSRGKPWTPQDTERALDIYNSEQRTSLDLSASVDVENSRVLRTRRRPEVQEADTDSHESLSEQTFSAERSTTTSSDRQDDSGADSYRAEPQSPSELYAAAKTKLAARQQKRQQISSPRSFPNSEFEVLIPKESIDKVTMGEPIPADVVHATLKVLCAIVGQGVTVAEPDAPVAFSSLDRQNEGRRFIPLQYSDRWALAVMSAGSKDIRVYEPQPSLENRQTVTIYILRRTNGVLQTDIDFTAPMLQGTEGSLESGVLLLLTAFCLTLRLDIPSRVDFNVWRHVIHALLWAPSMGSYPQPTGFESTIHIGQWPESLSPRQLAEHLNAIRLQADLALRRFELTSTSVRFILKLCLHLESSAAIGPEGQEDLAVRLLRMRNLCQIVQRTVDSEERELKRVVRNLPV